LQKSDQRPSLGIIGEHAKGSVGTKAPTSAARLDAMESRVNGLEFFQEEIGLENRYREELNEYVKELRSESVQIREARFWIGLSSFTAAAILFALPFIITGIAPSWFTKIPDYPKAALIIGSFASGVLLLLTITKSVFRSAHERQNDEFIPPQIKIIHELMKGGN
jgi:hypothetical protein